MNDPSPLLADAILPSLILIWPITVVLLLPIIIVEAQYARRRLNLKPGQAFRVFAVANVISTIIGFPLATEVANILQIKVQNHLYGSPQLNFEQWGRGGDPSNLARGLGQYPHWPLFAAAGGGGETRSDPAVPSLKAKLGPRAATTAAAHKIAVIFYTMVKKQVEYDESIWATRDAHREKPFEMKVKRQARQLGYELVPIEHEAA